MSAWTEERNRIVSILRALVIDTPERKSALKWAVQKLEGLPEHWIELSSGAEIDDLKIENKRLQAIIMDVHGELFHGFCECRICSPIDSNIHER